MILISFSIALIAIVFGAKLLAQTQKDNLGSLYKYISWFVMIMAFLVLMCDGVHSIMRCCHRCDERMMHRECMMMNRGCNDPCMMGDNNIDCPMMRHCNRGNMCNGNNSCDGMMNGGGKCPDGMMNCPDAKGGMNSGCPMMMDGKKCKGDSGKAK